MKKLSSALRTAFFSAVAVFLAVPAWAASVPQVNPQQCQLPAACIDLNQALASINQNASGYQALNFLDNGGMLITQRGTGIATGATTAGPLVTSYAADRWAIECNVTSCAPRGAVVTSATSVTFAPAFANMLSVYRNSGALTQPICAEQEIESASFTRLQGRAVILSAWIAANTGFPTGGAVTGYLITGTGSDQGLGALRSAVGMTASPALTPVWTGLATASATLSATPTTTATRYSSGQIQVPATATEGAVLFCFTPSTETAGTTNGFLFTGAQLEEADPNQTTAGRYYRAPVADETMKAQRFYVQWADNLAATFTLPGTCAETTSGTVAACTMILPQTQALAAPIAAVATATSFGMTKVADGTAEACSTLAVIASSNTPNSIGLTCAASETAAVGTMHRLLYANSGAANTLTVNSDF